MLKQVIKIKALNIDNEEIQFQIDLSNGINTTSIDFYGYADEFDNFANELLTFPKTIDSEAKYELGEQGEKWAYFILMRVFCYEKNGHSAIHIIVDNNGKQPYTNKTEFYIMTVPASLNELGQLLKSWNPKTQNEILWTAE